MRAYRSSMATTPTFSLREFARVLAFDSADDAVVFLGAMGLECTENVVRLDKATYRIPATEAFPHFRHDWVEDLCPATLGEAVFGRPLPPFHPHIPEDSPAGTAQRTSAQQEEAKQRAAAAAESRAAAQAAQKARQQSLAAAQRAAEEKAKREREEIRLQQEKEDRRRREMDDKKKAHAAAEAKAQAEKKAEEEAAAARHKEAEETARKEREAREAEAKRQEAAARAEARRLAEEKRLREEAAAHAEAERKVAAERARKLAEQRATAAVAESCIAEIVAEDVPALAQQVVTAYCKELELERILGQFRLRVIMRRWRRALSAAQTRRLFRPTASSRSLSSRMEGFLPPSKPTALSLRRVKLPSSSSAPARSPSMASMEDPPAKRLPVSTRSPMTLIQERSAIADAMEKRASQAPALEEMWSPLDLANIILPALVRVNPEVTDLYFKLVLVTATSTCPFFDWLVSKLTIDGEAEDALDVCIFAQHRDLGRRQLRVETPTKAEGRLSVAVHHVVAPGDGSTEWPANIRSQFDGASAVMFALAEPQPGEDLGSYWSLCRSALTGVRKSLHAEAWLPFLVLHNFGDVREGQIDAALGLGTSCSAEFSIARSFGVATQEAISLAQENDMDPGQLAAQLLQDAAVWLASCARAQADLGPAKALLSDLVDQLVWPNLRSLGSTASVRPSDLVAAHNAALRQAEDAARSGADGHPVPADEMRWPPPEFPQPPAQVPPGVNRSLADARLPGVPSLPSGLAGEDLWVADVKRAMDYVRALAPESDGLNSAPLLSAVSAAIEQAAVLHSHRSHSDTASSIGFALRSTPLHAVPWSVVFEAIATNTVEKLRLHDTVVEYDQLAVADVLAALAPPATSAAFPSRGELEDAPDVAGSGRISPVAQKRKRPTEPPTGPALHKQARVQPTADLYTSSTRSRPPVFSALNESIQAEKAASQDFEDLLLSWCSEGAPLTMAAVREELSPPHDGAVPTSHLGPRESQNLGFKTESLVVGFVAGGRLCDVTQASGFRHTHPDA